MILPFENIKLNFLNKLSLFFDFRVL